MCSNLWPAEAPGASQPEEPEQREADSSAGGMVWVPHTSPDSLKRFRRRGPSLKPALPEVRS
ncbi:hypothetical protein F7725_012335 [Dissostichus mawsoni]|uniref:Uncharacterized protein n=1 Tax=Dissostichus mawsoni TaxID=36200 RepID=A0A7J5YN69_DISMA|nr:hypothetical protein F7725_012335 [Dissostichus mawsoni]